MEVALLWLQDQVKKAKIHLVKVKGTDNPSDLMTKYLTRSEIDKFLGMLRYDFEGGRSSVIDGGQS